MPDNDIFRWHIKREWQHAARLNLGVDGDPNAISTAIRELGKELKNEGCPQFPNIIEIVMETFKSKDSRSARRSAFDRLATICQVEGCDNTQIAADVARGLIIKWRSPDVRTGVEVAAQILAGIAVSRMFQPVVLHHLSVKNGMAFSDLINRRELCSALITAAPETISLAKMLLADPSGTSVRAPRPKRTTMSQFDILSRPLTTS